MTIAPRRLAVRSIALLLVFGLHACAMVGVKHIGSHDYVTAQRSDVLAAGRLSDRTIQALNVVALTADSCAKAFAACVDTVMRTPGLNDEQRLSATAELWLGKAIKSDRPKSDAAMDDATLDAFLQAARYAYAYLFYTARTPADRAFDLRQVQVIDFYNYAVQRTVIRFFQELPRMSKAWTQMPLAGWTVLRPQTDLKLAGDARAPVELIPAASLRFGGLRNVYTRDGFGSEFVAVAPPEPPDSRIPWRDPDYVAMTGALIFEGHTLDEVIATRQVDIVARDPYRDDAISLADRKVPLAANFTAAYGVWLARSGFASQSIRSLLGREGGIKTPRVLLMQPYDPDRLIVVMLHGLASSPEAWINVSNEVMGDENLRRNYQVWEVYYPTNAPVPVNLAGIRKALDETLRHYDPTGQARASRNMVLVGHSMGGVIARLLVSSSGDRLWSVIPMPKQLSAARQARIRQRLAPYLHFTPMPQVTRAVFLASPHRGTPYAQQKLARWIGNLIRLPANLLSDFADLAADLKNDAPNSKPARLPNSIDNLSDTDPFIVAAANLPISPRVRYNTILGVYKPKGPLPTTSDGVVPYTSAHLDGAESELVIPSWHSVQETPTAILELRRILRLQEAASN
jgi:triacylglycerol esterase/lipase EstA (alpha/beta hydrolase family)